MPFDLQDIVKHQVQGLAGHHLGVQLAHETCGGVAGVGEWLLALLQALLIQCLKAVFGHKDFSPHG
jgi:hypothetical protein